MPKLTLIISHLQNQSQVITYLINYKNQIYKSDKTNCPVTYAINLGLPRLHQRFWNEYSIEKLYTLYKSLTANHEEVIKMIREPDTMNGAEERVYGYLIKFVVSLKPEDLQGFLQFVTDT